MIRLTFAALKTINLKRRVVRVVEGARLESVYTSKGYRGFESLTLRMSRKASKELLKNSCKVIFQMIAHSIAEKFGSAIF